MGLLGGKTTFEYMYIYIYICFEFKAPKLLSKERKKEIRRGENELDLYFLTWPARGFMVWCLPPLQKDGINSGCN